MKFNELIKNKKILTAIEQIGFDEMMPIQEKAIPYILEGNNVIGEAHTGTGKTAAFALPLVEMIDPNIKGIQALIMAPTRELAIQIVNEFDKISKNLKFKTTALVGGMNIREQIKDLKNNPQVIVATPGRLVDLIERKKVNLKTINFFVLDEVDEMLKVGFKEEIDKIISLLPEEKQTLLFSATISATVKKIALSINDNFEIISVTKGTQSTASIKQLCIITEEKKKFKLLTKLLDIENPELAIIFGRTKRRVDELTDALNSCGYKAGAIHGDLSQAQRNNVLKRFKNNKLNILVATDVAARGLDIEGITHVFNFDLPQEVEYYIHRIGRTGRANNQGVSYSFVRESEIHHIDKIKKETKSIIEIVTEPQNNQLTEAQTENIIKNIDTKLKKDFTIDKKIINTLKETYSYDELAKVLAGYLSPKRRNAEIKLTGEPPVGRKKQKKGNYKKRSSNRNFKTRNKRSRNNNKRR